MTCISARRYIFLSAFICMDVQKNKSSHNVPRYFLILGIRFRWFIGCKDTLFFRIFLHLTMFFLIYMPELWKSSTFFLSFVDNSLYLCAEYPLGSSYRMVV